VSVTTGAKATCAAQLCSTELAFRASNIGVVELLLDAGADVRVQTTAGVTALHAAAEGYHSDIVELLLQAGADVRIQTTAGVTALHAAADGDRSGMVELLLQAGADVHAQTAAGDTALHKAVAASKKNSRTSSTTVKALLTVRPATAAATIAADDDNSSQQQQQQQLLLAQQDANGCTALHLAVGTDRLSGYKTEVLTALLEHSSATDLAAALILSDKHGSTVLHYAIAKACDTETLELLLAACTRVGALQQLLSLSDAAGLTPVHVARMYNDAAVISVVQRYTNQVTLTHKHTEVAC
jgi:ankyrin repeat protein